MLTPSHQSPAVVERKVVLLVEDRVTKSYLSEAWGPDEQLFNIRPVGGVSTVKGMVKELRGDGHVNVFGFVDRDFGDTNRVNWNNVMLDWPALAGCELNQNRTYPRSAKEIEETALTEARKQPWWLACRSCMASWQRRLCDGFPSVPRLAEMTDFQPAFDHLADSHWLTSLQARTGETCDRVALEAELRTAHAAYDQDLANNSWKASFSGKEVFRVLLSRIHDVAPSVSREADVDLAKSVARWQYDNAAVPAEIEELKTALMGRVGLA
jgi:hypothetical protein